jgi:hypothetical protein
MRRWSVPPLAFLIACSSSTAPPPSVLGTWTFHLGSLSAAPHISPTQFAVTLSPRDEGPIGVLPILLDDITPGLTNPTPFDSAQLITFTSRVDTTIGTRNVLVHGGDTLVAFTSLSAALDCGALVIMATINPAKDSAVGWEYLLSRSDFITPCGDSSRFVATKP